MVNPQLPAEERLPSGIREATPDEVKSRATLQSAFERPVLRGHEEEGGPTFKCPNCSAVIVEHMPMIVTDAVLRCPGCREPYVLVY